MEGRRDGERRGGRRDGEEGGAGIPSPLLFTRVRGASSTTRAHTRSPIVLSSVSLLSLSDFFPLSLFLYVRTYVRCLYARAIRATVGM